MSQRSELSDLEAFTAIAKAGGFRKAAALRGVSGSALSHSMRALEERLGVRLFHRTSRSVSLTAAGQLLMAELEPNLQGIHAAIDKLARFREGPAGRIRVTVLRDAAILLLAKRMPSFFMQYPDIEVELNVEDRFVDMVADGFDAGIRYGGTVPEGMVAARLTGDLEWVAVASPQYIAENGRPQVPEDLMGHHCIRIRTGTDRIYHWEFDNGERQVSVDVPGRIMVGDSETSIRFAEAGVGVFYGLRKRMEEALAEGRLEVLLPDWSPKSSGFHAYYASHRQVPTALRALIDHLKIHDGNQPR